MNFKHTLYFVFAILLLSSCTARKPLANQANRQLAVDSIYDMMKSHQFEAEWFNGKFKGAYHMPDNKQVFSGQVRIKKDSIIWVSVYAVMNIEVFRLEVRPDSFFFINKLEKNYMSESIAYFKDRFNVDVDFEMLQSVLMGNDFPYYETGVFKLENSIHNYQLSTVARRKLKNEVNDNAELNRILVQNIWIDKNNYRIVKQNVKVVGQDKAKLRVQYDRFEEVEGQLFPSLMVFQLKEDQNTFLELDFSRMIINEEQTFPFRIPDKYERKDIEFH
jgi:hypothetical protein